MGVRSQKILPWQPDYILLVTKSVFAKDPRGHDYCEECSLRCEHVATSTTTVKLCALSGWFGMLGVHLPERRTFTDEENCRPIVAGATLGEAISRAAQSIRPCGRPSGFEVTPNCP